MGLLSRRRKAVLVGSGSPRRKQRQKIASRLRLVGLLALLVGLVALSLWGGSREAAVRAASLDLEQIAVATRDFRQDLGRCPRDPDELAHPPAGATRYLARPPRDPWGRPYHLRCPGRWQEDEVDVASAGPDGLWDGGDDVSTDL